MRVSNVKVEPTSEGFRASATVVGPSSLQGELWFETQGSPALPSPEMAASAFLAACLPTAVWWEEDLIVDDPIDEDLLFQTHRLAGATRRLYGRTRTIEVQATGKTSEPPSGRKVGASFTGGLDSFYTLYDNLEGPTRVGALVTGLGLDTKLDDREGQACLMERLGRTAQAHGLAHYGVRTNFRTLFDPYADPTSVTQGGCLVAFAFLLSGSLHTYLIPSSVPIDRLYPYSSHSLLESGWISSHARTFSSGWDVDREEKLRRLLGWDAPFEELRICQAGRGLSNCGRCEKCARTMALMALEGVWPAPAFPHPLAASHIRALNLRSPRMVYWWSRIAAEAAEKPDLKWLAQGARFLVLKWHLMAPLRPLHRRKKRRHFPLRCP